MTFRLAFQISRVGALCRPANPDGLVSKLVVQKGNLKKLISLYTKKNRSASLLQECNNAVSYVPTNHSSTLTGCEYAKTPAPKLQVIKECEANDYYPKCEVQNFYKKLEETNVEPYANRIPCENRPKISFSNRCIQQLNTVLPKYDNYEMEINDIKIKDIKDQKSTATKSEETKSIMSDLELKIQNDIWLQSSSEIVNSLNSKNSIWKLINCNQQTMNNDFTNFTSQMQTKTDAKDGRTVHFGTRHYPCIYMPIKKMTKRNYLDIASKVKTRFRQDLKKIERGKERRAVLQEHTRRKPVEQKQNTQISGSEKSNEISNNLERKQSVIDSKFKIIRSRVNVSPSKINNMSVYNRRPIHPAYRNSYRFYHMNSTKDLESCNTLKYSKINYKAENNTNLLLNEIVQKGIMLSASNIPVKAKAPIESATPNKISEPIPKEEPSSRTTNEVARQCSESSAHLKQKKGDTKIENKIKSTRIPRTLGEIYGVRKIPFLVEVSKAGQATHKQYLVVMQLPEIREQDSYLSCTNSPLSLIINNNDTDSDFSQEETLLSPRASLSNNFKANQIPGQTLINNKHVPEVDSIGLVKNKNKILPLLEINEKHYESFVPTKLSQQLIEPTLNKKDKDTDWAQETSASTSTSPSQCGLNDADDHSKIATSTHGKDHSKKLQSILSNTDYMNSRKKLNAPALSNFNQVRLYSTMNRRNKTKILFPGVEHKCNYCCCYGYPCCGPYSRACRCQCSPCGWYPDYSCRPQCCPKFQLECCCPRGRWDCSIPIPPCAKIEAPYPSYGENMPMWCKEPTECFDFEEHMLQPKNQVSPKINLMEESIPKVTVVDPALERKCCLDKWCEPYYPCIDQRICFCGPYQIPVDCCCPRGRPHCYCWPERPVIRNPPPYRCFSDEDLEFPEVEITEHDLAKRFASDLYRRMGKKCLKPFTPAYMVDCDLRSGEPQPVCKYDPKRPCTTTCVPPGAYLAPCTYQRIAPCEIPCCNTWNNCRMPMEGNKKTIARKK